MRKFSIQSPPPSQSMVRFVVVSCESFASSVVQVAFPGATPYLSVIWRRMAPISVMAWQLPAWHSRAALCSCSGVYTAVWTISTWSYCCQNAWQFVCHALPWLVDCLSVAGCSTALRRGSSTGLLGATGPEISGVGLWLVVGHVILRSLSVNYLPSVYSVAYLSVWWRCSFWVSSESSASSLVCLTWE